MSSKKVEAHSSIAHESCNTWPFMIKLTTDHMRWDSLKISNSKQLETHILDNINEANRRVLDAWIPLDMSIHDVDTGETYNVKLAKKESFWFEPTPFLEEKLIRNKKQPYSSSCSSSSTTTETREEFAYSIEPFRWITQKRNLSYGQEIGLRWSGNKAIDRLEFSVLYVPRLDLLKFRA